MQCSAMQWMDEDVDLDEVECILSNLIYQGKIKGYISHEKRTLIISKADPFPRDGVIKVWNWIYSNKEAGKMEKVATVLKQP